MDLFLELELLAGIRGIVRFDPIREGLISNNVV